MMKKMLFVFVLFLLVGTNFVIAQGFGSFSSGGFGSSVFSRQDGFQSIQRQSIDTDVRRLYGSDYSTYWPRLGDPVSCEAREDIILQVSPAGCQPGVVRSDLLAEQNVPVFCQIDALKLNPLIDVDQIRSIRFTGDFPDEVVGVGFHPARAALRSQSRLIGSPLINNIGYATVVLRQNPVEAEIPEFVNFTLHARLDYNAAGGIGLGATEFLLEEQSDDVFFSSGKARQSFWQGRYSVRLEDANTDRAIVSIYSEDRKIQSVTVDRRKLSQEIYLPGFYCQAGIQFRYDGFTKAENTARIQVDEDVLEVVEGSKFLNGKCRVSNIDTLGDDERVDIVCGSEKMTFLLGEKEIAAGDDVLLVGQSERLTGDEEIWRVREAEGDRYILSRENEDDMNVSLSEIIPFLGSGEGLKELDYGGDAEKYFRDALESFGQVVDEYPLERPVQEETGNLNSPYGEKAMIEAINLAERYGKEFTMASLINKFLEIYPDSVHADEMNSRLLRVYRKDTTLAGQSIEVDNEVRHIILLEINEPDSVASAKLRWDNDEFRVEEGEDSTRPGKGKVALTKVEADSVRISAICDNDNLKGFSGTLKFGNGEQACGGIITLEDVEFDQLAKIRVQPRTRGLGSETNFTVGIGIEKRNIELNPEKAVKKIEELNDTIKKWEDVSENLGKAVTGLKAACFATAGVLTAKNFLTGLGGEGFARKQVMQGHWNNFCDDAVRSGEFSTRDACFNEHSDEIDADVNRASEFMEKIDRISESAEVLDNEGGLFSEEVINRNRTINNILGRSEFRDQGVYGSYEVDMGNGRSVSVNELLNGASYDFGDYNYDHIRDVMYNVELAKSGDANLAKIGNERLREIAEQIEDNKVLSAEIREDRADQSTGLPGLATPVGGGSGRTIAAPVVQWSKVMSDEVDLYTPEDFLTVPAIPTGQIPDEAYVARVPVTRGENVLPNGDRVTFDHTGTALLVLNAPDGEGIYGIDQIYFKGTGTGDNHLLLPEKDVNDFKNVYGLSNIKPASSVSYHNRYLNPELSYYETEPYKGMPAVVPFDVQNGWYAAVEQTLPVFGGMAGYDSSGRPVSFWVCNVGEDGREQFFENRGNDICQQVNVNAGGPFDAFYNLNEEQARVIIRKARDALLEAARKYEGGVRFVGINGESIEVGRPAANVPGSQCQDFMSPKECTLLFNVCDPVICPSSRCDFGGDYPVANVHETGIVGSALLCLPNFVGFGGDVAVPVCLTGIKAGIDSYSSILRSHQQCLAEQVETGRTVGICDEITSVYTCEFFWRQAAPLADIIVPKLFEIATGQRGSRGGGEYLSVGNAWQNAQDSIDYFSNSYAVNSLDAFKIRSTEEVGSTFCKAFISAKAPKAFEGLIEPDSPTQFYGFFSSTRFSDASVPATAQYKVFYHIFAGNDRGVQYSVYLKDPPESSFYSVNPTVQVDAGFIPRGEFGTESVDFTAPEGYKQLCIRVNDREECGFKQVTTDFAVNYLRDEFVSDELTRKDITEQSECISGGVNGAALLNPNIQSGIEEAINPEVYNRGINRVCASRNPGSETDPERFVDVGYCDDQSIRCWLDKKSVDNALSSNLNANEGIKNSTLAEIEEGQVGALKASGELLHEDEVSSIIKGLERDVNDERSIVNTRTVQEFLNIIDATFTKAFLNSQKAALIYLKGMFNKRVSEGLVVGEIPVALPSGEPTSEEDEEAETEGDYSFRKEETDLFSGRVVYVLYDGGSPSDMEVYVVSGGGGSWSVFLNQQNVGDAELSNEFITLSNIDYGKLQSISASEEVVDFFRSSGVVRIFIEETLPSNTGQAAEPPGN